ncbi:hypothetical protein TRFO_32135 [Tritrichomonas foetus]|uniref:Uncharacterized protein n=1 Tax=Tritrichomonas foetus TaxID=1144522 RepID=A0A1J4JUP4_9EUKA|nr:hypothetical protein TRFO_32135 [Tritrichomonas foetus]|eukprot:OHT00973.1 hypothetical protein TRFO_32135 [Tritrichomonas foetus]
MFNCFDFYKDIGFICGDVQFDITYAGDWPFLAVAVDNSFHIYSAEELKLTYVSEPQAEKIKHIAADPNYVCTVTNSKLRVTNQVKNEFDEIDLDEPVSNLLAVGSMVVLTQGSVFKGINPYDLSDIIFETDVGCDISAILHPSGYAGKFLLALTDTTILLWNIHSDMQIYGFSGYNSIVRKIVQSTIIDIFVFVLEDGRLVFHDVKFDEFQFSLPHPSPVNDISFRTDGPGQIAVVLENGSLYVWDLKLKQIITNIPESHAAAATTVCFLKGQNKLITGGIDNAIRQWEFDPEASDVVRILRSRVGHQKPPSAIGFAEVNGINQLVTASGTSTVIASNPKSEMSSAILSIAPLNRKHMICDVKSLSTTNSQRYCSVATTHENGTLVFLWDIENQRFAKRTMTAMPKNGARVENDQNISFADFNGERKATCSCLTRCGNFGCVGTSAGTVEVFVTQSGRRKGSIEKAHDAPIVFVHVDSLNTQVVSGAEDGSIFFHNFTDLSFTGAVDIPAPLKGMSPHVNSQLLAIASNGKIVVLDCQSHHIAREFDVDGEHFCFSNDGKYFFVSCRNEVYLFDMITSTLIEKVTIDRPITGIAADPKGDLIATLHERSVATKLWYFRPNKITTVDSASNVGDAQQEGFAIFTVQPQLKIKNILNPPKDPLKFAKNKIIIPFFLQQTSTVGSVIDEAAALKELHDIVAPATEFVKLMVEESEGGNFDQTIQTLIEMNFDQISMEISALRVDDDGRDERLIFVQMLKYAVQRRTEFDIIQAIMSVFLNEYGVKILENPQLKSAVKELRDAQEEATNFLESDVSYSQYLVQLINRIV